ncbi:CoA-disulfide reductase [Jeotgalibacillus sp. S-D1]|uniref:CoA-disulfide reductase n=1 Tax=Jeotgalibacillus sp. S-D1 TaxID=2552189 RepID=UPI00105A527E|nr:CoA-disulfide reductase [Jeotgalibacillus sp. S-D1]TDL35337.1 CoA-disulfide reductase [Jeotgalibacillus sp. S-D1]
MKQKVLVIGGVAGGATFASQLRKLDKEAEIIVLEKDGTMSFANCGMPYYIGGFIKKREHLIAATPEAFQEDRNIEVRIRHEVTAINRSQKTITIQDHIQDKQYDESYDILILSPGATPVIPDIKGLAHANCYTLRTFKDMLKIDEHIESQQYTSVCIVGGGFIGLEMAENLKARGLKVHLVQRSRHVLHPLDEDMVDPIRSELLQQGVNLYEDVTIAHIDKDGQTLHLTNNKTIRADFLLLAVGVKPNRQLAEKADLKIGTTGGVKVNEFMQTSDSCIYALGDVVEILDKITGDPKRVPLAWVTHRQAFIAASHATGNPIPFKGALGTAVCKVFSITAAMLGLNEKTLQEKAIDYKTVEHESKQHAGYYPGAETFKLKVHYSNQDGKILGAQAVGKDGIDKRMDIIATAIAGGLSILDLQEIEIAYAPPYSAPKDPVNMIGYKALNK